MLDYAIVCDALTAWRAGTRPASGSHAAASRPAPRPDPVELVEESDSEAVEIDAVEEEA